jgi:hypothetical protein
MADNPNCAVDHGLRIPYWKVSVCVSGVKRCVGYFSSEEKAASFHRVLGDEVRKLDSRRITAVWIDIEIKRVKTKTGMRRVHSVDSTCIKFALRVFVVMRQVQTDDESDDDDDLLEEFRKVT